MQSFLGLLLIAAPFGVLALTSSSLEVAPHKGHHHHHGHHKKHANGSKPAITSKQNVSVVNGDAAMAANLLYKMKKMETDMSLKTKQDTAARRGELEVNGPLPADFNDRFAKEVAKATGCKPEDVRVLNTTVVEGHVGVDEIVFEAPPDVIKAVAEQAADPDSKLAKGPLRIFLIEKTEDDASETAEITDDASSALEKVEGKGAEAEAEVEKDAGSAAKEVEDEASSGEKEVEKEAGSAEKEVDSAEKEVEKKAGKVEKEAGLATSDEDEKASEDEEETPVQEKGIDVDTSMPYGELEPFGREDTAQELTKGSIRESDEMVDQLERAEVAEEKRAVFRALTRLRGAAITSFDGVARSQTGNIDSYARTNHWRSTHPVRHLADEESDVQKWAFPENSDF